MRERFLHRDGASSRTTNPMAGCCILFENRLFFDVDERRQDIQVGSVTRLPNPLNFLATLII